MKGYRKRRPTDDRKISIISVYDFVRIPSAANALGLQWNSAFHQSAIPADVEINVPDLALPSDGYCLESKLDIENHDIPCEDLLGSPHHILNSFAPIYTKLFLMSQSVHFLGSAGPDKSKVILSVRIAEGIEYVKQECSSMKKAKQEKQRAAEQGHLEGIISPRKMRRTSEPSVTKPARAKRSQSQAAMRRTGSRPLLTGERPTIHHGDDPGLRAVDAEDDEEFNTLHRMRSDSALAEAKPVGFLAMIEEEEEEAKPRGFLSLIDKGDKSDGGTVSKSSSEGIPCETELHEGPQGFLSLIGDTREEEAAAPQGFLALCGESLPPEAPAEPQGFLSAIGETRVEEPAAPQGFLTLIGETKEEVEGPQGFLGQLDEQEKNRILTRKESGDILQMLDHFVCFLQTCEGDVLFIVPTSMLCSGGEITTTQLVRRMTRIVRSFRLNLTVRAFTDLKVHLWQMQSSIVAVNHKIGVLLSLGGQTEEDQFYNNVHATEKFDRFLDLLGDRIQLRGFKGYDAGLDTQLDRTGTESIYRKFCGMPIMYHVSTMLPYSENKEQQLERKRHIGNDVVVILFQEDDDCMFDPGCVASRFNQIFIIVRPLSGSKDLYFVDICAKVEIGASAPFLPNPPVFSSETLGDFLVEKILVLETLAWSRLTTFSKPIKRSRQIFFDELFEKVGGDIE